MSSDIPIGVLADIARRRIYQVTSVSCFYGRHTNFNFTLLYFTLDPSNGGISFLISNKLIVIITCIATCECYAVIKVNNCLIINVYLPCSGTVKNDIILLDVISLNIYLYHRSHKFICSNMSLSLDI